LQIKQHIFKLFLTGWGSVHLKLGSTTAYAYQYCKAQLLWAPSALNWQELRVLITVITLLISQFVLHRVTSDELHFKVIIRSTNKFKISVQNYGISVW